MSLTYSLNSQNILEVTLNSPKSGNSFSLEMAKKLQQAIKKHPKMQGLQLSAAGRFFCAGGNLTDYSKMKTRQQGLGVNKQIGKVLQDVASLKVPTLCVVQGDCLGGGLELISAFDHILSVPEAMFGFWARKIGISYGWGGAARLALRIPPAQVKSLLLNTKTLSAQEALQLRLIDEVVLAPRIQDRVANHWQKLAALPKTPVAGIKTLHKVPEQKVIEKLWMNEEHKKVLRNW